jgi:inorganic pyrophosphatase
MSIWDHFDELVAGREVTVDRPRGRPHPRIARAVYPLDYGYLHDTDGGDGDGIDIWLGSAGNLGTTALLCTFDPVKLDAEVKVLWNCDAEDIAAIEQFYAPLAIAVHVVPRPRHAA